MNKKIFIIHSSEIIRKGLNSILRSYFNTEIIQLEQMDELKSFCEQTNQNILIIYECTTNQNLSHFQALQIKNRVKWIAFHNKKRNPDESLLCPDLEINDYTTALELHKVVSKCWDIKNQPVKSQTNEELTNREKEVLKLVALGFPNKVIAGKLFISIHTVISHRKNITEKTGIKSISGLTVFAILNNLIDTDTINPEDLI